MGHFETHKRAGEVLRTLTGTCKRSQAVTPVTPSSITENLRSFNHFLAYAPAAKLEKALRPAIETHPASRAKPDIRGPNSRTSERRDATNLLD